jgi:hypothetical protein
LQTRGAPIDSTALSSSKKKRERSVTHDRERAGDDRKGLDYCVAVTNACAMLPLSSNQLMVLREQPEAKPA